MIQLLLPKMGECVSLLREKHLAYIREPKNDPTSKVDWLNLREVQDDLSYPDPICFCYSPAVDGEIHLIPCGGNEQVFAASRGRAEISNLLLGTRYEWYVTANGEASERASFVTDATPPRMLYVEGISNVRDFGGFLTSDGAQRVRQEMILRTSEMDTHVEITEAGKQTFLDMGIRLDLDIRGIKDEPRAPILDEARVKWVNYPLAAYGEIFCERQLRLYGESYALLADSENYPMIVHCWGGIDRTGCWLYILGGMLGVGENDLGLDYEMSSFSRWGRRSRLSEQFEEFRKGLFQYGNTLQDACVGFMHAAGVTDAQMDRIRALLLEEV